MNLYDNERHLTALRKKYRTLMGTYVGTALLMLCLAGAYFAVGPGHTGSPVPLAVTAAVGLALAAAEYALERALFKKGKQTPFLLLGFFVLLVLLFLLAQQTRILEGNTTLFYPLVLAFLIGRPLIAAAALLRDGARLREGDLSETVGRVKEGSRREASEGRAVHVLFEDELTHETRLLRMGSVSPDRRYRVFYLPDSGLAVGEIIPDHLTFDPFGNPVERETEAAEDVPHPADTVADTAVADTPADAAADFIITADTHTESDPDIHTAPDTHTDPAEASEPRAARGPIPTPEDRRRAQQLALYKKLSTVAGTLFVIGGMILGVAIGNGLMAFLPFIPGVVLVILSSVFESRRLKLICTVRVVAVCVDTVYRHHGKSGSTHPIVSYEADGVTHTAELKVSCSRRSVGELYTIYYDPEDPDTVRSK